LKKKILVTGGAGFIGGNFVQYMVRKYTEYDIYNLDSLTYAGDLTKHKTMEEKDNYKFINADITDNETILSLFETEKFNYVVHFAAESHVDRSIIDPNIFVRTNVLGTQVLLNAAMHIDITKFIHISTDEVYGDLDYDSTDFFNEETPLQPNSPYSSSKAASDLLVRAYYKTYGLPVNITRCSNNYGPFHFPEKLIPLTISRIINNQKVPIYGDGRNVRDWLYVMDHCEAIDIVMHKGITGEVYNIGGHNEISNIDVVKKIINTFGKSEELIEFIHDRKGHDRRYAINPTKIKKLGWKPKMSFNEGIEKTIDWYLVNAEWWKKIISGNYQKYFEKQYEGRD